MSSEMRVHQRVTDKAIKIVQQFDREQEEAVAALCKAIPPGTSVSWEIWHDGKRHRQYGTVLGHESWSVGRIRVRNDKTGKKSKTRIGELSGFRVAGL